LANTIHENNVSFLGAFSKHVTKSCRYYIRCGQHFCRSFDYGA